MLYLAILAVSLIERDEEQTESGKEELYAGLLLSSTVHDMVSVIEICFAKVSPVKKSPLSDLLNVPVESKKQGRTQMHANKS